MEYIYKTKGTCSSKIRLDINDGVVTNVVFTGGCDGNLESHPPPGGRHDRGADRGEMQRHPLRLQVHILRRPAGLRGQRGLRSREEAEIRTKTHFGEKPTQEVRLFLLFFRKFCKEIWFWEL